MWYVLTCSAVLAAEPGVAHAAAGVHVPGAVSAAVGQTAPLLVLRGAAAVARPALAAHAAARHAVAVPRAVRVHTVNCNKNSFNTNIFICNILRNIF